MASNFVFYVLRNRWATKSTACTINLRPARDAPSPTGFCPDCDYPERDFLLIMDSSGSIGAANYIQAKEDLAIIASNLCGKLGTGLQVAAIQFSNGPEMEFPFDEFLPPLTKIDLYDDIEAWTWMTGMTLTWRAFNFSEVVMFKPAQGNRPGAYKQALIVTDGGSNGGSNPKARSIAAAQELKISGVEVYALWIGDPNSINYAEIRAYVSEPVNEHAFTVDSVQSLNEFAKDINNMYKKICC